MDIFIKHAVLDRMITWNLPPHRLNALTILCSRMPPINIGPSSYLLVTMPIFLTTWVPRLPFWTSLPISKKCKHNVPPVDTFTTALDTNKVHTCHLVHSTPCSTTQLVQSLQIDSMNPKGLFAGPLQAILIHYFQSVSGVSKRWKKSHKCSRHTARR